MSKSNLAAYLAKNYLTASTSTSNPDSDFADSTRPKKRRKKTKLGDGLIIADDDEDLSLRRGVGGDGDDANEVPVFETGVRSAEFRKKKSGSGWKVVSEPTNATANTTSAAAAADDKATNNRRRGHGDGSDEAAEADRILAEAEQEARVRRRELGDEDAPAIVDSADAGGDDDNVTTPALMASGVRAGLQTAADTAALMAREKEREEQEQQELARRRKSKSSKKAPAEDEQEQETIYRDATGRRIDISMKRAEARAAEQEKLRAERKAREDAMGDVQRREKELRKQQLEEAKFMPLARGADDDEMNDMLRKQRRWDDPMAAYLAQRQAEGDSDKEVESQVTGKDVGSAKTVARSGGGSGGGTKKKVYAGHAPPNRYGILPGWRWDGVDRSTGFEKEWFQARSRNARTEELKYQWQMDE
ncbi:hypothetical protein A1O3_07133 [Capronia epimyces CBS 606.96]|uniref:Pre-mRNA-splicing factor CWC26 n=1 Tax=Capronia epimyces CBS 606.96 TaxID=1182542 RepID=W9XK40_9EURO|nr:uncharacterized protein A1O3_07133 [Capronia epimyces CBS 606.96]EXJ80847.1 hypothetical protein A1O3_07133 [Capronia epimyces CBS 606.96]